MLVNVLRDGRRTAVIHGEQNMTLYRPLGLVQATVMNEPFEVVVGEAEGYPEQRILTGQPGDAIVNLNGHVKVIEAAYFGLMFEQVPEPQRGQ